MRVFFLIPTVLIFLSQSSIVHPLTCADVLELPSDKKLTLSELKSLQQKEIVECLAHLGKEQLAAEEAEFIWKTIVDHFGGIAEIPDSVLMILHWVTVAITPQEYENVTLDNIDVVENFGLNYNLKEEQLAAIGNRVREDFAGKDFEDYTYYDLLALKQILCAFNRSEVERIHPRAYREAALMVGKLEHCGAETMAGFASLATNAAAFGSPDNWTEATIKILGKVADHLPDNIVARIKTKTETKLSSEIF